MDDIAVGRAVMARGSGSVRGGLLGTQPTGDRPGSLTGILPLVKASQTTGSGVRSSNLLRDMLAEPA